MVGTGQTDADPGRQVRRRARCASPPSSARARSRQRSSRAFEGEDPDVIIVEGQGALSHPAYLTSALHPARQPPDGRHPAARARAHVLGDFPMLPMPTAASEIALIEAFADTRVIGITINHEDMTDAEVDRGDRAIRAELGIPVTDALTRPPDAPRRHGPDRLPGVAGSARPQCDDAPRLEIDLDAIEAQRRVLVDRLAAKGIRVTGSHQGDARVPGRRRRDAARRRPCARRLADREPRAARARAVAAPITLIRSPMLSQVDRVVGARRRQPQHRGRRSSRPSPPRRRAGPDARRSCSWWSSATSARGSWPSIVLVPPGHVLDGAGLHLRRLGTNLACQHGVVPDQSKMDELSRLAADVEAHVGVSLSVVSGGNSITMDHFMERS